MEYGTPAVREGWQLVEGCGSRWERVGRGESGREESEGRVSLECGVGQRSEGRNHVKVWSRGWGWGVKQRSYAPGSKPTTYTQL